MAGQSKNTGCTGRPWPIRPSALEWSFSKKPSVKKNRSQLSATDGELLKAIDNLQQTAAKSHGTFEIVRGLKVFHKNLLYITKPLGQRFWTNTAALNDADEIAATILTRTAREGT